MIRRESFKQVDAGLDSFSVLKAEKQFFFSLPLYFYFGKHSKFFSLPSHAAF